jgi:OOP family OmpA-OmpF porin
MGTRLQGRLFGLGGAAAAMLLAGSALGQARPTYPGLNLERFAFSPSGQGSLVVDTGLLMDEGDFRLGTGIHHADGSSVTRLGADHASLRLDSRLLGNFTGAYAPNKWVQLELQLPVIFRQRGSEAYAERGLAPVAPNGYATPLVGLRVGLLRQREGGPVDLALSGTVGLPMGHPGALGRDDGVTFRPALSLGRDLGPVRVGASAYAFRRTPQSFAATGVSTSETDTLDHEVGLGLVGSSEVVSGLRAEVGATSDFSLGNPGNSTQTWVGARYALAPRMEVFALGGPGFGTLVGTPRYRAAAGLAFGLGAAPASPREELRLATIEPAKIDQVTVAPPPPLDVDADGDGVPDSKDACPQLAGPAHRAGCPIPDADGDGVADDIDRCPAVKGDPDEGGCPTADADGDGVPDRADRCPGKPGPGTEHGCPDTDGDQVADHLDNCVLEKGPAENQGCPARDKQLVVITQERLQILDKVYFTPGKAQIQPRSRLLLNQVARVLKEHPEIERVVIEGHTDNVGNAQRNLALSQDRADSVRRYLIAQGVAPDRLEARGFGQDNPLHPNTSPEGREANRRVEFVITPANRGGASSLIEPLIRD